jgi:hypothetical protein
MAFPELAAGLAPHWKWLAAAAMDGGAFTFGG